MMISIKKFSNQKTTIVGLFLAILLAIQPLTTVEGFDIRKDWLQMIFAAAIGIFGWLAQDSEVNTAVAKNKKLKGE